MASGKLSTLSVRPEEGLSLSKSCLEGRRSAVHPSRRRFTCVQRLLRTNGPARLFPLASLAILPLLSACARQMEGAVSHAPDTPGFILGLWHGFIFPVAWVFSLFDAHVAIYAVPNTGGWYDFGYFLGIVVFGVGARGGTRVVYRERVRYRNAPRGTVIDHEP